MTLKEALLWPLTIPYGAVAHLRARVYRTGLLPQRRLDGVVISIGNLTTGGTGKTPMVLWIAQKLISEGNKPGILTRGYRGEASAIGSTSDEVRLMQSRLGGRAEFGVGADRIARGRDLRHRGVRWFILDDGFQHLQLARDVDIVLIDATNPFGGGHLLPAGRLREPRSALARADIIVITRGKLEPVIESTICRDSDAPIFYAQTQLDSVRTWNGDMPSEEARDIRSRKLFAFCGIGNPEAFLADLRGWGFQLAGWKFYPDHHRYTQDDVSAIQAEASKVGAAEFICTEKDIFNLQNARWPARKVHFCCVSLQIDREGEFWSKIVQTAEWRASSREQRTR